MIIGSKRENSTGGICADVVIAGHAERLQSILISMCAHSNAADGLIGGLIGIALAEWKLKRRRVTAINCRGHIESDPA